MTAQSQDAFIPPVFILVRPQLAENIGTAARAMMNCAIEEMRLVKPNESPVCSKAIAASSGAEEILYNAKIFDTLADAVADLHKVYATTGRLRDMVKPVLSETGMQEDVLRCSQSGMKCGILFGPERTGLENEEIAYADTLITIPLSPKHCSLNLAQAVLLVGYELFKNSLDSEKSYQPKTQTESATKEELEHFFQRFEKDLSLAGYFSVEEKKPRMVRNLRNIFTRAELTSPEVRTLHGVLNDLTAHKKES